MMNPVDEEDNESIDRTKLFGKYTSIVRNIIYTLWEYVIRMIKVE